MSDSLPTDAAKLVEHLRAIHEDDRLFVDALLAQVDSSSAAHVRYLEPVAEAALSKSREIGYELGEAKGLLAVGFIHYLWQRNQEAIPLILEAKSRLESFDEAVPTAKCCAALAGLSNTFGNYQQALEYGHEALATLADHTPGEWHGWPHYMLGDAHRATGDLSLARQHYEAAYDVFTSDGVMGGVGRALIGLGGVCREQSDLAASEAHFKEALGLAKGRNDAFATARCLSELALTRQLDGDYDAAISLFEESLEIRRGQGGGLLAATCLIDLGKLHIEIDRTEEAIENLKEALALSVEHNHQPRTFAAHKALSEAYSKTGDLDKALFHHREFQRIKEEVMTADLSTRLRNLEISLAAAAAQKEAELIKTHNEELRSKNTELARLLKELRDTQEMLIQSEKMASLGQLTAGIAHEIRNPLNFVNNFSAITKDLAEELTAEITTHRDDAVRAIEKEILELASDITENAERILEHGSRAGQIVNSMLVHSRQSGGKKTEVDVNELVTTCVDLAYHGFLATEAEFEVDIGYELDKDAGVFMVIEDEVARVLTNIVNNALYAVRDHASSVENGFVPRISVRTAHHHGTIEVTISDNGPGIADDQKQKVFEPFYTTKPTGSGTGLGLSQSYEIIAKRHGGSITIVDADGGGAMFRITLPSDKQT